VTIHPISTFVVDDDELSRELLLLMLDHSGHPVHGFSSGEAVLESLRDGALPPPSHIVTDLQMPGLCGDALAARLRQVAPEAILLAISARQPLPKILSAFDGFLLKPFSADQLAEALATPGRASASASDPSLAEPTVPALDPTIYRKLAAGMKPEQLRQLYQLSVADATRRGALLQAAAQAGDETAFIREAHALQGGCGLIGALELRSIACVLEQQGLSAAALLPQISAATGRLQRILESLNQM